MRAHDRFSRMEGRENPYARTLKKSLVASSCHDPAASFNTDIVQGTPFGPVAILWTDSGDRPTIVRILLSKPRLSAEHRASELYPDARSASCREIDALAAAIRAFLEGEDVTFALSSVDLRSCSAFQQSVLRAEHRIPRGSVSTYRDIAVHLGVPNGARAVGNALANNPFPLIVPCHRAIRSDGRLGGFQGGIAMKRALLDNEGIVLDEAGRVDDIARFGAVGEERRANRHRRIGCARDGDHRRRLERRAGKRIVLDD